ncbi:MAG: hypothetical protein GXY65_05750 [Rhodococcus sp.]|nr:hypothetical protein [Rhodococcus sp. (in: high G+C Gram-positive bacteria)]NLV78839.1 hypothetical protein [Rhodococcus sp. (in: high G+C Gram-positive bacteria)]
MQPLRCSDCMAQVLVRKNSWEHTEVQWSVESRRQCRELNGCDTVDHRPGAPLPKCSALDATIRKAAAEGLIEVVYDAPIPAPIVQ